MKTYVKILVLTLILSAFAGIAASETPVVVTEPGTITGKPGENQDMNFSKLEILPPYANFRLQPGESKEITVTLNNKDDKTVSINPVVVIQPYGNYMMDKNWITVIPVSKDIPAGGSEKFIVKIAIPADASAGYYNPIIAFTNESFPSPYQSPVPNYVHTLGLSVEVWKKPVIQITNPYIYDQVEAGKETDYKVKIKNIGTKPIPIDPKMTEDNMYYWPYGTEQAFTDDAITLSSPKEIPPNSTIELNIHLKVPVGAKGTYRGAIDPGIQDSSMMDTYMFRIQLEISVWTQPTEPYVKTFTSNAAGPLSIEVSSNMGMYSPSPSVSKKDPSFIVNLTGSDNKEIPLNKTKTVIKGGASLGGTMYPPWQSDGEGIYQEFSTQYSETYTANVQTDDLKLSIMPQFTQQFEYIITVGTN